MVFTTRASKERWPLVFLFSGVGDVALEPVANLFQANLLFVDDYIELGLVDIDLFVQESESAFNLFQAKL